MEINYAIRGIEIYFAGSAIQCLNNQGLVDSTFHLLNNSTKAR